MKCVLNKFGLFTQDQLAKMLRDQSNRIHKGYQDKKNILQNNLETGLTEILISPRHRNNKYFTMMPLADKNNSFYWIVNFFDESGYSVHLSGEMWIYDFFEPKFISTNPSLFYEIHSNRIKIIDFNTTTFKNRGIGSKILTILEQMAITLNIEYISGQLASTDYEDRDAQIRFYTRNGYTVKPGDKTHCGSIRKNIIY